MWLEKPIEIICWVLDNSKSFLCNKFSKKERDDSQIFFIHHLLFYPFLPFKKSPVHHLQIWYIINPRRAGYRKTVVHLIPHEMSYAQPVCFPFPALDSMAEDLSTNGNHSARVIQKFGFNIRQAEPRSFVVPCTDQKVVHGW